MANEIVPMPMFEPLVVDLNNEMLREANEWVDRSCLVRIFWDLPVPLHIVRRMLEDVWKCSGDLNIFEVGLGLYQFIFPSVQKRNWVLKTQPWSFKLSIMNMIRFLTPSENLFNQLQFMDIAVKLAGIPIDYRTLAFGRQMQKIGEGCKDHCSFLARGGGFFLHLIFKQETRWICIPDCGKLVEGPNLQRKFTTKYQSRSGAPLLPPSVMAYFVAARSNPQSPEQGKISNQATEKGGQSSSSSTAMALEQANGSQDDVGSKKIVNVENSTGTDLLLN